MHSDGLEHASVADDADEDTDRCALGVDIGAGGRAGNTVTNRATTTDNAVVEDVVVVVIFESSDSKAVSSDDDHVAAGIVGDSSHIGVDDR